MAQMLAKRKFNRARLRKFLSASVRTVDWPVIADFLRGALTGGAKGSVGGGITTSGVVATGAAVGVAGATGATGAAVAVAVAAGVVVVGVTGAVAAGVAGAVVAAAAGGAAAFFVTTLRTFLGFAASVGGGSKVGGGGGGVRLILMGVVVGRPNSRGASSCAKACDIMIVAKLTIKNALMLSLLRCANIC